MATLTVLRGEPAPAQLQTDVSNLISLEEAAKSILLTAALKFLRDEDAESLKSEMVKLAESGTAQLAQIRSAARGLVSIGTSARDTLCSKQALETDLNTLGLSGMFLQQMVSEISLLYNANTPTGPPANRSSASPAAQTVSVTNSADVFVLSANQLVDMSWRFGLTAGNNSIKHVGESFLQLALHLDEGNAQRKIVHLELTLPQFYSFLAELERAKQMMELFS